MARSESLLKLRGTIDNLTFVKSRTYGDHVRAKRGTYKNAEVNDAFKQESKSLLSANVPAKIINDAIEPFRGELRGGLLWQRLVSLFRKQLKDHGTFDFSKLAHFEIHADYPFERLLDVRATTKFVKKTSTLHVEIRYDHNPAFGKAKYIDGYRLTIIGIFPDLKKKKATAVQFTSDVMKLTGVASPLAVQLDVPKAAKSFIVCVKIEGCMKAIVNNTRTTQGMKVVSAGALHPFSPRRR